MGAGPLDFPHQWVLGFSLDRQSLPGASQGDLLAGPQLLLLSGGHHLLSHRGITAVAPGIRFSLESGRYYLGTFGSAGWVFSGQPFGRSSAAGPAPSDSTRSCSTRSPRKRCPSCLLSSGSTCSWPVGPLPISFFSGYQFPPRRKALELLPKSSPAFPAPALFEARGYSQWVSLGAPNFRAMILWGGLLFVTSRGWVLSLGLFFSFLVEHWFFSHSEHTPFSLFWDNNPCPPSGGALLFNSLAIHSHYLLQLFSYSLRIFSSS